ncbi:MAG: histidine kinase [Pyrinomonadaceae bacterium]
MQFGRSTLVNASPLVRYGVALSFLFIAGVFRLGLGAVVNRPISAPIFLAAIILSTWLGGLRLGIFASIVASLTLDYFFFQPFTGQLHINDHIVRFFLFAAEGALLSWLVDRLRLSTEEIIASREELRELAEQQRATQDSEKKRIAREIHDELGQDLTSLKLGIHLIRRKIAGQTGSDDPHVLDEIDGLSRQVDSTIGTVRRIATDLRPSVLDDFGLVAAIEWQTTEFEKRSEIECVFTSNSAAIELDPDASTAIFRIFQEALTNVARHANATRVRIHIDHSNNGIHLSVEDNGKGIDASRMERVKSLGLLGMSERARLIGGEVTIAQAGSSGTRVELFAPVTPNGTNSGDDK